MSRDFLKCLYLCFFTSERGNATVEFLILLPLTLAIAFSSLESGMLTTRQMLLEHSLDKTVRNIRVGNLSDSSHASIKSAVCDSAFLINNCMSNLKLEMIERDPNSWTQVPRDTSCVDTASSARANNSPLPTQKHRIMFLKACATFTPILPSSGLGFLIHNGGDDTTYAITAMSAYSIVDPL